MAKDSIFTWVLIGGAAYLAWNWWTSQPVAAAAPPAGGTTPPATPAAPTVAYVPPTQTQQLQTAAGAGVTVLNADQWSYYWNQLGFPSIDPTKWQNVFFPNGRPASGSAAPTMTAGAYVSALQGAGLAGYRRGMGAFHIPVPVVGHYTLGDLRRAGGR